MRELVELLEFVQRRQEMAGAMTKTSAVLNDGVFGPQRRPTMSWYNVVFEDEARRLMSHLFQINKTPQICFELAELYKFGVNPYFPGLDIASDYPRAAYWYVESADLGHKETLKFFHRMVPQYFMEKMSPHDVFEAVITALVEQEKLAKAYEGETLEERKWRESVNDFVIDLFLYPEDQELDDEFWFNTLGKRFGHVPGEEIFRKNNVRPIF